jgi:serine incorporator 1/3
MCCTALTCCCGLTCAVPVPIAAWLYFAGYLVLASVSYVLRSYSGTALDFGPADGCSETGVCGPLAVLRLSFGSAIFFATMAVLLLGVKSKDSPRVVLHTGLWPFKLLLWGGLAGSTFAMPNGVFEVWQEIARVFAAIFIVLQLIILLEFVYAINEWLLERDDAFARVMLVASTLLLIVGSIVGLGFLYTYWAPNGGCSLNIFFITFALILFLLYAFISISPWRVESAGLLTSAVVFCFCTYYTWSALQSQPPGECTPSGDGGGSAVRIIGFIIALLAMGITTVNSGRSSAAFSLRNDPEAGQGEDDDALPYRPDFFYVIFMLASAYMAMLLIGWDMLGEEQGEFTIDKGWGSVWAKIVASWLCAALYTWSLIAHNIFTGREF